MERKKTSLHARPIDRRILGQVGCKSDLTSHPPIHQPTHPSNIPHRACFLPWLFSLKRAMTWLFLLFVTLSTCSCSTAFVNLTSPSYIVVPAALSPSSFVGDAIASQETKRDDEGGAYTISNQPETAQGGEVSTDRQSGGDDESGDSEVEVVPPRWNAQLDAFNFLFLLEHGARERESIYSKARFLGWCQNKKKAEDRWKAHSRKKSAS